MSDLSVAAVAVERCKTELREFRIPDIPADAGLLRVVATGMCGADWPMYQNDKPGPRILGHEIEGVLHFGFWILSGGCSASILLHLLKNNPHSYFI